MNPTHFYAISRRDLPVHQQAIQASHAQLEYCRLLGCPEGEHPTFVWLTVESKWHLLNLVSMLDYNSVKAVKFYDPDYAGYDPSAIACLVPEEKRYLLSNLPLWKCEAPRRKWFSFLRKVVARRGKNS